MTLTKEFAETVGPVIRWARENGWQHDAYPRHACTERWRVYYWRTAVSFTNRRTGHEQVIGVRTAQQAIDVLAALGVIPARFSSQWQAGRDVALEAVAANVLLPYDLPPGVQDAEVVREAVRAELAAVYMTPDAATEQASGYPIGQRSRA